MLLHKSQHGLWPDGDPQCRTEKTHSTCDNHVWRQHTGTGTARKSHLGSSGLQWPACSLAFGAQHSKFCHPLCRLRDGLCARRPTSAAANRRPTPPQPPLPRAFPRGATINSVARVGCAPPRAAGDAHEAHAVQPHTGTLAGPLVRFRRPSPSAVVSAASRHARAPAHERLACGAHQRAPRLGLAARLNIARLTAGRRTRAQPAPNTPRGGRPPSVRSPRRLRWRRTRRRARAGGRGRAQTHAIRRAPWRTV